MRRQFRRLRLAIAYREWPRNVPWYVVDGIQTKRPPEHVLEAFRKLHGIEGEPIPDGGVAFADEEPSGSGDESPPLTSGPKVDE